MKILITGRPGCGKSTLINELIEEFKDKKISGIITPEIRINKSRFGFKIIDLKTGRKDILASTDIKKGPKVSKYSVNIEGIDKIVDTFMKSFEESDICFIDEIGKMEFFSEKFKQMLDNIFASDKHVVATIGLSFSKEFQKKYKAKLFVIKDNKEEIKKEILGELK